MSFPDNMGIIISGRLHSAIGLACSAPRIVVSLNAPFRVHRTNTFLAPSEVEDNDDDVAIPLNESFCFEVEVASVHDVVVNVHVTDGQGGLATGLPTVGYCVVRAAKHAGKGVQRFFLGPLLFEEVWRENKYTSDQAYGALDMELHIEDTGAVPAKLIRGDVDGSPMEARSFVPYEPHLTVQIDGHPRPGVCAGDAFYATRHSALVLPFPNERGSCAVAYFPDVEGGNVMAASAIVRTLATGGMKRVLSQRVAVGQRSVGGVCMGAGEMGWSLAVQEGCAAVELRYLVDECAHRAIVSGRKQVNDGRAHHIAFAVRPSLKGRKRVVLFVDGEVDFEEDGIPGHAEWRVPPAAPVFVGGWCGTVENSGGLEGIAPVDVGRTDVPMAAAGELRVVAPKGRGFHGMIGHVMVSRKTWAEREIAEQARAADAAEDVPMATPPGYFSTQAGFNAAWGARAAASVVRPFSYYTSSPGYYRPVGVSVSAEEDSDRAVLSAPFTIESGYKHHYERAWKVPRAWCWDKFREHDHESKVDREAREKALRDAVRKLDINKDGFITKKDFGILMTSYGAKLSQAEVDRMLEVTQAVDECGDIFLDDLASALINL